MKSTLSLPLLLLLRLQDIALIILTPTPTVTVDITISLSTRALASPLMSQETLMTIVLSLTLLTHLKAYLVTLIIIDPSLIQPILLREFPRTLTTTLLSKSLRTLMTIVPMYQRTHTLTVMVTSLTRPISLTSIDTLEVAAMTTSPRSTVLMDIILKKDIVPIALLAITNPITKIIELAITRIEFMDVPMTPRSPSILDQSALVVLALTNNLVVSDNSTLLEALQALLASVVLESTAEEVKKITLSMLVELLPPMVIISLHLSTLVLITSLLIDQDLSALLPRRAGLLDLRIPTALRDLELLKDQEPPSKVISTLSIHRHQRDQADQVVLKDLVSSTKLQRSALLLALAVPLDPRVLKDQVSTNSSDLRFRDLSIS